MTRTDRLAEAHDQLVAAIEGLINSRDWRRFLDTAFDAIRNGRDFLQETDGKKLVELENAWHRTLPSQVQARARAGRTFVEATTPTPRF